MKASNVEIKPSENAFNKGKLIYQDAFESSLHRKKGRRSKLF